MPSTSEVGHAKNVANLQKLTEQVTVYTLYNPPVDNLKIPNLQALYTTANTKLTEVEDKRNANKNYLLNHTKHMRKDGPKGYRHYHHLHLSGFDHSIIKIIKE